MARLSAGVKSKAKKPAQKSKKNLNTQTTSETNTIRLQQKAAAVEIREFKKAMKAKLQALKSDYQQQLREVTQAAYQKAQEQFEQAVAKQTQQKIKLLQETAVKFEREFWGKLTKKSPIAKSSAKKVKETLKAKPVKKAKLTATKTTLTKRGRGRPAKQR